MDWQYHFKFSLGDSVISTHFAMEQIYSQYIVKRGEADLKLGQHGPNHFWVALILNVLVRSKPRLKWKFQTLIGSYSYFQKRNQDEPSLLTYNVK